MSGLRLAGADRGCGLARHGHRQGGPVRRDELDQTEPADLLRLPATLDAALRGRGNLRQDARLSRRKPLRGPGAFASEVDAGSREETRQTKKLDTTNREVGGIIISASLCGPLKQQANKKVDEREALSHGFGQRATPQVGGTFRGVERPPPSFTGMVLSFTLRP